MALARMQKMPPSVMHGGTSGSTFSMAARRDGSGSRSRCLPSHASAAASFISGVIRGSWKNPANGNGWKRCCGFSGRHRRRLPGFQMARSAGSQHERGRDSNTKCVCPRIGTNEHRIRSRMIHPSLLFIRGNSCRFVDKSGISPPPPPRFSQPIIAMDARTTSPAENAVGSETLTLVLWMSVIVAP